MGIGFFIELAVLQPEIVPTLEEASRKAYLKIMNRQKQSKKYSKMIADFLAFTSLARGKVNWLLKPMTQVAVDEATTEKMKELRTLKDVDEHGLDDWAIYMDEALKM